MAARLSRRFLGHMAMIGFATLIAGSFSFGSLAEISKLLFTYHMSSWQLFFLRSADYAEIAISGAYLLPTEVLKGDRHTNERPFLRSDRVYNPMLFFQRS